MGARWHSTEPEPNSQVQHLYLYNRGVRHARSSLYKYVSDIVQHIQHIQHWMSKTPIYKNQATPADSFAINRFPESHSASSGVSPSSTVIGKWSEHKMGTVMYSHLVKECWLHCDCCNTIGFAGLIMTPLFPSTWSYLHSSQMMHLCWLRSKSRMDGMTPIGNH